MKNLLLAIIIGVVALFLVSFVIHAVFALLPIVLFAVIVWLVYVALNSRDKNNSGSL